MKFNEDSRVKIPTILHLMRLGYEYLSLNGQKWDQSTNIFTDIFYQSIKRLNPEMNDGDVCPVDLSCIDFKIFSEYLASKKHNAVQRMAVLLTAVILC